MMGGGGGGGGEKHATDLFLIWHKNAKEAATVQRLHTNLGF